MKLCLIAPYAYQLFHPQDGRALPFSGSEVQQYQLANVLAKDPSWEVHVLVGDFYAEQPMEERLPGESGGTLHVRKSIRCGRRRPWENVLDLWRLYRALRPTNADVVLIRGGGSLAGKVAFVAKKLLGMRFVYSSAHDRDSNGEYERGHGFPLPQMFRYALRKADRVICQHEGQRQGFQERFGIDAIVLPTMYAMEASLPEHQRASVLWVSRLEEWKRPEVVLELARALPETPFVMITSSDATNFRKQLPENVVLHERVPFVDMDRFFQEARVFLNTSTAEGFPNTFVQAAKNGTPILSLSVDPDGMLEGHDLGTCVQGNQQQLRTALTELLENRALWRRMSQHGFAYAHQRHERTMVGQRYRELFSTLTASQP